MTPTIDKGAETREHIAQVQRRLTTVVEELEERAELHDASKLVEPELSAFYAMNEINARGDVEYGSPEYKALMASQQPAIHHHYELNDHHPEYWRYHRPASRERRLPETEPTEGGALIACMSLPALLEMLCDWDAAAKRYKDGSFAGSWQKNIARFGIGPQLASILLNTAFALAFVTKDELPALRTLHCDDPTAGDGPCSCGGEWVLGNHFYPDEVVQGRTALEVAE